VAAKPSSCKASSLNTLPNRNHPRSCYRQLPQAIIRLDVHRVDDNRAPVAEDFGASDAHFVKISDCAPRISPSRLRSLLISSEETMSTPCAADHVDSPRVANSENLVKRKIDLRQTFLDLDECLAPKIGVRSRFASLRRTSSRRTECLHFSRQTRPSSSCHVPQPVDPSGEIRSSGGGHGNS
jgi:hypothetical protein